MDFKDYYKILGVERQATAKEIKNAYRALARKFHPDVNPGDKSAEQKFAEINEANEVLSNEEERKKYDEIADYVKAGGRPPQASGQGQHHYQPEDLEDLFGSQGEGASFFEQFFGRRQSRSAPRKGADIHAQVEIALREALLGATRLLSLERQETCGRCHGAGVEARSVCPECRGRGQVILPQTLEVKIPSGVTQGSTIRLQGQGQSGTPGAPPGDLFLEIHLQEDPVYKVEGADLRRELEVSIFTAMLGGEVAFEGLRGKLSLKIPAESQNGKVFRLREQGLPRTGGKPAGDLYIKINLRIPTGLSGEQQESFRKLRESVEPSK